MAKAKANRKSRLAQDKVQDRTFLKGEDITTSADGANLGTLSTLQNPGAIIFGIALPGSFIRDE